MKIIVAIVPTNVVPNSLLSLFCSALETKNKNLLGVFKKISKILEIHGQKHKNSFFK